jgi:uncharacterized protein (DUF885 family)
MRQRVIQTLFVILFTLSLSAQTEEQSLEAYFRQYLDDQFALRPLTATRLGDHRFDHLLDDVSKESRKQWIDLDKRFLKELPRRVDYSKLSRAGQVDFEILKHELEQGIWSDENFKPYEEDPRIYGGFISDSIYTLLTQSTAPLETNVANAISRMRKIPAIIAAAQKNLTRPPKQHLETAIRQNKGAIGYYETAVFEDAKNSTQLPQMHEAAKPIVAALKEYQTFLEGELSQRATGEWRIGKKKFAKKLEMVLDAGMNADQVLADAESEFARVEREMYVVSRQLWSKYFPKQVLPPDDDAGRRETVFKVTNAVSQEHGKPEDLIIDARNGVEQIKKFIAEHDFLKLPAPDRCQILEMPEFRRGNSIAYLDNAPPLDREANSVYAISPPPSDWNEVRKKSFLEEYNRHMLQILTIHEAYPGHYVQLEYANRNPSLIRKVLGSGVYIEGWAVYTEQTMLDQGYGEGNLQLRLMQLKFYLRAVGNAILDNKMHCTKMTDDEALRFLMDRVFQSEGEARLKVIRAKQSSTQLSTYFVGRMAHYRVRQQIERELGPKFNLGRYHEAVLELGSVPVKYLPELVRARLR